MLKARQKIKEKLPVKIQKILRASLLLFLVTFTSEIMAQSTIHLNGNVVDETGEGVIGASVVVKGTKVATITDFDGNFSLEVPLKSTLSVSYIGCITKEIVVTDTKPLKIVLHEDKKTLDEVVVVGYGTQKKATLVGSVTQTGFKELSRTGGVANLGQALTGNLPGLTTVQTNSMPGDEDPQIFIRGQSSWNSASPYILVDGVERRMNDIDVNEIESISVLKDASATAVYGVKGANGVILITTKRGNVGKPVISVSANTTVKMPSLLVDKLDSYDALMLKNASIEREVAVNQGSWSDYTPLEIVKRYRNQSSLKYPEAYPNIDWQKLMLRDYTLDSHINLSASGGNDKVKYFTSFSYLNENDMFKRPGYLDSSRYYGSSYKPGFGYNRFNARVNVDVNVTKTTKLSLNLSSIYSVGKKTNGITDNATYYQNMILNSLYATAPDLYYPMYSNGNFGTTTKTTNGYNPYLMYSTGYYRTKTTNLTSDLVLNQDLGFITKGLSAMLKFSFDNTSVNQDSFSSPGNFASEYIDPAIEDATPGTESQYIMVDESGMYNGNMAFSPMGRPWWYNTETANLSQLQRRMYYQAQLNYSRQFGKHDIGATGVFTREELATGSEFLRYREDWIFRATYNYDTRYFMEFNGAYNGSEKFSNNYRFAFFPSFGAGWNVNKEKFMKDCKWLDNLKLRYNIGLIGDDNVSGRWLYMSQYGTAGNAMISDQVGQKSTYTVYRQTSVGNEDIHWEKARKTNYGFDISILNSLASLSVDIFDESRSDIILVGTSRVLPVYYPSVYIPTSNVGKVKKHGYEIQYSMKKNFGKDLYTWGTFNMTHVKDKVIYKEEPKLKDSYLLSEGYSLGQNRTYVNDGFIKSWNEIYASPALTSNDGSKLVGDYRILDYNADGVIDVNDNIPYGYSNVPQNTYSLSLGVEYKGFSAMVQFYGVNNVTRYVARTNFDTYTDIAYSYAQNYWSIDNPNGDSFLPRWRALGGQTANSYYLDGSYIRLKNAEIAYTFDKGFVKKIGLSSLRVYVNGNNLLFWSKELPDDREYGSGATYPSTKRINMGIDLKF